MYTCSIGIDLSVNDEIVRQVTATISAERIFMFGSTVTGEMTPDSDIDLLVIARGYENSCEEWVRVRGFYAATLPRTGAWS